MLRRARQRGQAIVESAIVLPLNVFIILGVIQYGLIAHARAMAKYAAYRAVRVGSLMHADPDKMRLAALFTMLPVLTTTYSGAPVTGAETIGDASTATKVIEKWWEIRLQDQMMAINTLGLKYVNVAICGPLQGDLDNNDISDMNNNDGDSNEVDFDDPRVATEGTESPRTITGFKKFMRTKLRIQVQVSYRMPIPFANWIIAQAYLGESLPDVLRMKTQSTIPSIPNVSAYHYAQIRFAASRGIYIAPINVGYAMRMQSNFDKSKLPRNNECIHYEAQ